jgi:phage terminase large subunit-like protein
VKMGRGNARVAPKGNTILVTKQAAGSAKIDPLKVAFSTIALTSTNPSSSRSSTFII